MSGSRTEKVEFTCVVNNERVSVWVAPEDLTAYAANQGDVQTAFPYLTAAERELFISSICRTCWFEIMAPDPDGV